MNIARDEHGEPILDSDGDVIPMTLDEDFPPEVWTPELREALRKNDERMLMEYRRVNREGIPIVVNKGPCNCEDLRKRVHEMFQSV